MRTVYAVTVNALNYDDRGRVALVTFDEEQANRKAAELDKGDDIVTVEGWDAEKGVQIF